MTNDASTADRPFDGIWCELESRHAWEIQVVESNNPPPAISRMVYCWSDYDNRHAAEFRSRYRLEEVIGDAADDWEAAIRLRHWTFVNMVNDTEACLPFQESFSALDPVAMVEASRAGGTFWCSYFSMVFVAAATAAGIAARKLSIDNEHTAEEKGSHHGVVDVWSGRHGKWVHLDPNYDHHYELDGVPLNTEEICQLWQRQRGQGLTPVIGPDQRVAPRGRAARKDSPEACGCFWHLIECRNDVFRRDGRGGKSPAVMLVDQARKNQRWYQGTPPQTFEKEQYSDGTLLITEEPADAYPDLDAACIQLLPPHKMPYYCRVRLTSPAAPFFSHYEIRVDGGPAERVDGLEFPWRLHPGQCTIEARTVSVAGWRGPIYSMKLQIRENPSAQPQWPRPAADV